MTTRNRLNQIGTSVPTNVLKKLNDIADELAMSRSRVVCKAVEQYVEHWQNK